MQYCISSASGLSLVLWRFFDFITESGENLIAAWYEAQDPDVQAQFDATLLFLRATHDWEYPRIDEFKALTGRNQGLGELRFDVRVNRHGSRNPVKRRFRPVGIWPPVSPNSFILILGCEKSGRGTYVPHCAFDIAMRHKADFENREGAIHEHPVG
mgnify:CR=1 FL=1